jgi:hypothetical protein
VVRNREKPHPRNARSPLTVVVTASLLAGSIGSYSLIAPGGLNLLDAQGGRPGVVTASTPGQAAALLAYQRPAQRGVVLLADGNQPSGNPVVPVQVLPSNSNDKQPMTFSLFAGWGGAVTWDPSSGEVTVAVGVGRQFSLSMNDLPSSGSSKDDGSFFKGAGIQGEFGGKIPQAWASKVPGMQWAAGATITGKLNGKWSTDGSLTFRAIGQLKLPPALVSKLPPEFQTLFKNGSLSYGYQWKVNTHGSADARNWTIVSSETGTLNGASYSFGSPGKSATDSAAGTISALGSQIFDFFKGGDFGGHVAGNVTVALGPRLRDAINSYMEHAFGDYSKQLNQDTKKLQDTNGQLQQDLKKNQTPQNQQQIKNLGNQIGTESGKLQKDISQYQQGTAQGVQDILNNYNKQQQQPQKNTPQTPGLAPARQNDPAGGTRPPFVPPANQQTTGAPPTPGGGPRSGNNLGGRLGSQLGGTNNQAGSGSKGGTGSQPGRTQQQLRGTAQSGGVGIQLGPVQGLPGTQSGPAVNRPQPGTQSSPSTPPQRGQGAGSGIGQPGGSGTPARSSGQQGSAGGSSGAVGGLGGQAPSLTPPPSVTAALSGGVAPAPPAGQVPQPLNSTRPVQQPVLGGGSRPPASQPPASQPPGNQPADNQPATGQGQQSAGTPSSDTQGGGGQTQQPGAQTQPGGQAQPDTQSQPGTQPSGQVQGLPGTQSGPAATPPGGSAPSAGGANPDVNPDGTINTPPLDRTEPDGTPFQNTPTQPATPSQDPTKPPVIVPPPVADNGSGSQVGQTPDGTPVTTASASTSDAAPAPAPAAVTPPPAPATPPPVDTAPVDTAPIDTTPVDTAPAVTAPVTPPITPVPIPVAAPANPVVDSPATVDTADPASVDTADTSVGDFGTPAGVGGDVSSGDTVVADLGGDASSGDG